MFGLFRKRSGEDSSPLKKRIDELKCRKINYVDTDFDELCRDMEKDPKSVIKLRPVNYYAIKNKYIMGMLYSSEDLRENYIRFLHFESERQTGKSGIYAIDDETAVKVLAKVGVMIDLKKLREE
ncbi:MAG: hypothetical protein IJ806_11350 [Ruminococcus sp.]|nr:hypothetical protein [Ruminococcus sp.]